MSGAASASSAAQPKASQTLVQKYASCCRAVRLGACAMQATRPKLRTMVSAPKASAAIAQTPKSAGGTSRGRIAIDTAVDSTESTRVASMACVPVRARAARSLRARSSRRKPPRVDEAAGAQPRGGQRQRFGHREARRVAQHAARFFRRIGHAPAEGSELIRARRAADAGFGVLHHAARELGALVDGHDL